MFDKITQDEIDSVESLIASSGYTPEQMVTIGAIEGLVNNYLPEYREQYESIYVEMVLYCGEVDAAKEYKRTFSEFSRGFNGDGFHKLLSSLPILAIVLHPLTFEQLKELMLIINKEHSKMCIEGIEAGYVLGLEISEASGIVQ